MNSLLASKACNITGVVGIACARHGCYVPNSLVDLFKGEQQKNVDFAFLNAQMHMNVAPEQGTLLIYDIAYQYFIHFHDQISSHIPFGLQVEVAIGLFHVHAHKDNCFFCYATSFILGAGVVAGEILESHWSSLNSISPMARTATIAYRAKMLDNHATDSNYKKYSALFQHYGNHIGQLLIWLKVHNYTMTTLSYRLDLWQLQNGVQISKQLKGIVYMTLKQWIYMQQS